MPIVDMKGNHLEAENDLYDNPEHLIKPSNYNQLNPPIAFNQEAFECYYQPEPWDKNLPQSGFVTDFVLYTRGMAAPTAFSTMVGLFITSSILKRSCWLEWIDGDPLYPNFFSILIGPPGLFKKSAIISRGKKVLIGAYDYIQNILINEEKRTRIFGGKISPEAITELMKPTTRRVIMPDKRILSIDKGSELIVMNGELATMLGRQQYNTGLIERLTAFYDSEDVHDDMTIGRGDNQLRNIFFNLIGGATPSSFEESLPVGASGGGFLSRTIVTMVDKPSRIIAKPFQIPGVTSEELQKRLAWIAENSRGEYRLSEEAEKLYREWYKWFIESCYNMSLENSKELEVKSRFDVIILKTALILRAQRYEKGNLISAKDFLDAKRIIYGASTMTGDLLEGVTTPESMKTRLKVRQLIRQEGSIARRQLLSRVSHTATAAEVNKSLETLAQAGFIEIEREGVLTQIPSTWQKEIYRWIGE